MARAGYVPARGGFVRVVLDPRVGREQSGERPALVLSDREFNQHTGYVFVAPITCTRRGWPFEVPIAPGTKVEGVVLADQTKSIDHVARHVRYIAASPHRRRGLSKLCWSCNYPFALTARAKKIARARVCVGIMLAPLKAYRALNAFYRRSSAFIGG
jgi:mRNA interferase MazF